MALTMISHFVINTRGMQQRFKVLSADLFTKAAASRD